MKKAILAATAAVAAFGMAPAANAAITINDPINLPGALFSDSFSATVSGETGAWTFVIPISFSVMSDWNALVSITSVSSANVNDITFTGGSLGGVALAPSVSGAIARLESVAFSPLSGGGPFSVTVSGTGNGTFGGSISVTAVPEPGTWAMMILGIGAVGVMMRRRSQNVRVSFS